ncbi:unnamed protein product [Notodromas monacha]|uniref:Multifunctional methyltransferase subunit TRM112-like protein n=1 Tax=Notodromas monacha TaxID=399045 RepID=A0A7R9GBV6_9CRUS|nr:unnamed protein product [Notodromas monacha]CAG0916803.1 unnamed protein product [Notodromas monacha]
MKLVTHNMLSSKCLKGVVKGFPLKIHAVEVKTHEVEFNKEQVIRLIPKLEWPALCEAAESLGELSGLPPDVGPDFEGDEDFLKKAHHILFEVDVVNGELECPETGHKFPVRNGIPNMLADQKDHSADS